MRNKIETHRVFNPVGLMKLQLQSPGASVDTHGEGSGGPSSTLSSAAVKGVERKDFAGKAHKALYSRQQHPQNQLISSSQSEAVLTLPLSPPSLPSPPPLPQALPPSLLMWPLVSPEHLLQLQDMAVVVDLRNHEE